MTALGDGSDATYGKMASPSLPADYPGVFPTLGAGERIVSACPYARAKMPGSQADILAAQADVYRQVLATCLTVPACTALVTWGVGDRYTWRYPDTPLLLDREFQPKPAHAALLELLRAASPGSAPR